MDEPSKLKALLEKKDRFFQGGELNEGEQSRLLLWLMVLIILIGGIWAAFSKVDQVTRVKGQVIASSRTQLVQSGDGGIIKEILVSEGDKVKQGQVLVRLDKTKVETSFLETRSKASALRATEARLKAEIFGGEPKFSKDISDYPKFKETQILLLKKRRTAISEEIQSLEGLRLLAQKELSLSQPLLKTGDVSLADILKLQRQVADLQAQITNKKNKYFQDTQAELQKTQEDLSGIEQMLASKQDQLDHTELKAPADGIVKNIRLTTLGGVLKPTEDLMDIVPIEDDLIIECKVKPINIGFIKMGMPVNIKIDAYDYTIFGTLGGKVIYISADTLSEETKQGGQDYYRLRVEATNHQFSKKTEDKRIQIQPGMTAIVEIKTGTNNVLRYLLKPVVKTLGESLGER